MSRAPQSRLFTGYVLYFLALWGVLSLPFAVAGDAPSWINNAFIAASAVSTTGLVSVDVGETYSLLGELAILFAIQLGGLGYMTLGSFVLMSLNESISGTRVRIGHFGFNLPPRFSLRRFIRRVVLYTLTVEALGAVLLAWQFGDRYGGAELGWLALFHSVSAFCTAGFSLFPDSLEQYRTNTTVNAIAISLSFLGAIGFIVFNDLCEKLTRWNSYGISLTSQIILVASCTSLLVSVTALRFTDPSLQAYSSSEAWLIAFFQAASALTTVGFNTIPIGELSLASLALFLLLMTLGASPGGTGGGLKSTTWFTAGASLLSAMRFRRSAQAQVLLFGREVPTRRVVAATAALVLYFLCFFTGLYLLLLCEPELSFGDLAFEASSALGTVGLSRGITAELSDLGKGIVIALMLVGRAGPLTIALAFAAALRSDHDDEDKGDAPEEDVALS